MSSNRVRCTDDVALDTITAAFYDKFRKFMENSGADDKQRETQPLFLKKFEEVFKESIKLNIRFDNDSDEQQAGVTNERSNYYNEELYSQMHSLLFEVADKRKHYPSTICNYLKDKHEAQQKLIQLKKNSCHDVEFPQPVISPFTNEMHNSPENLRKNFSKITTFNKIYDTELQEKCEYYKCMNQQLELIQGINKD